MFSSIHSAIPRDMRTWASPGYTFHHLTDPPIGEAAPFNGNTANAATLPSNSASRRNKTHEVRNYPTFLQQLNMDEEAMRTQKVNISRFGAAWLRPAGIPKTLQAMEDEETEKQELAEQERRSRVMAEETAAAEEAARRIARGFGDEGAMNFQAEEEMQDEEDQGAQEERDLDEDVPEADEAMYEDEELEITGVTQDDTAIDLDDDIPEAGSYQHTDTELEDASDEENEGDQSLMTNTPTTDIARAAQLRRELTQSPQIENESLDSSSPVARRAPRRERGGPRLRTSG